MGLSNGFTVTSCVASEKNKRNDVVTSYVSQKDRFRGAMLGLVLAPTAVSLTVAQCSGINTAEQLTEIRAALSDIMEQICSFVSVPSIPFQRACGKTLDKTTWLDAVPTLLRYHGHPDSRSFWQSDAATTAQYWVLSDILACVMRNQPLDKTWLMRQVQQTLQAGIASSVARHYCWLWHNLEKTLLNSRPRTPENADYSQPPSFSASENLTSHEMASHHAVVSGASCALAAIYEEQVANISCNYGLSVAMAMQQVSVSGDWHALLIAGFISGAIVGQGNLPVSWQQRQFYKQRKETVSTVSVERSQRSSIAVSLADALYHQWSGSLVDPQALSLT